jgi:hypothetical protein
VKAKEKSVLVLAVANMFMMLLANNFHDGAESECSNREAAAKFCRQRKRSLAHQT